MSVSSARRQQSAGDAPQILTENPVVAACQTTTTPPPSSAGAAGHRNSTLRETGIVEKLLTSYGFIQCCDREARLFFHSSEFTGRHEDTNKVGGKYQTLVSSSATDLGPRRDELKVGDPVEFEMHYDRRSGKPLACKLQRLQPGSVSFEILSDSRVVGTIVSESKPVKNRNNSASTLSVPLEGMGQVSFDSGGEYFFLPYSIEDLENGMKPKMNDLVTFYIATDKRTGSLRARKVQLSKQAYETRCQGVVCCMKDTYGFIERSDIVKEIFFHYSEAQDMENLAMGDDVEFDIETKNGKEMATNIVRLHPGSVVFEDISEEAIRGTILRTLKGAHMPKAKEPLSGRIIYEPVTGHPVEIPFGERDQLGDYTVYPGDIVQFNIATDRRNHLQRATNMQLLNETFVVNKEKRETGAIVTMKEGYGFIRCADRDARMFFHFNEMLNPSRHPRPGDEVEFTVAPDPNNPGRYVSIRVEYLAPGSVQFETVSEEIHYGQVVKEPQTHKTPGRNKELDLGFISYSTGAGGRDQKIEYTINGIEEVRCMPRHGDRVSFHVMTEKYTERRSAVGVLPTSRLTVHRLQGFIATLKENFGFIETAEHDHEVFFHYSSYPGDPSVLEVGDEVEYTLIRKNGKISADAIKRLPRGTVAPEEVHPEEYQGRVLRPLRIVDPDQDAYAGLVQMGSEETPNPVVFEYGVTGLADKRDFLQSGDLVTFQLCAVRASGTRRACHVNGIRRNRRAKIDSVKGQYGFIDFEAVEGRKLFFHMTEVHDHVDIRPGEEVDFVVVQNQRNGRFAACSVRKVGSSARSTPPRVGDITPASVLHALNQSKADDAAAALAARLQDASV